MKGVRLSIVTHEGCKVVHCDPCDNVHTHTHTHTHIYIYLHTNMAHSVLSRHIHSLKSSTQVILNAWVHSWLSTVLWLPVWWEKYTEWGVLWPMKKIWSNCVPSWRSLGSWKSRENKGFPCCLGKVNGDSPIHQHQTTSIRLYAHLQTQVATFWDCCGIWTRENELTFLHGINKWGESSCLADCRTGYKVKVVRHRENKSKTQMSEKMGMGVEMRNRNVLSSNKETPLYMYDSLVAAGRSWKFTAQWLCFVSNLAGQGSMIQWTVHIVAQVQHIRKRAKAFVAQVEQITKRAKAFVTQVEHITKWAKAFVAQVQHITKRAKAIATTLLSQPKNTPTLF